MGFGVGDTAMMVAPMTPDEASKVPQGSFGPVLLTLVPAVTGGMIGWAAGAIGSGLLHKKGHSTPLGMAIGAATGTLAGAAIGATSAAQYGKKQQRAAETLALLAPITPSSP